MTGITADMIEARLLLEYGGNKVAWPRFEPTGWWEADVCRITKAGYFYEYEIKVTKADFNQDAHKSRGGQTWNRPMQLKRDELERGNPKGPVRFFYVVPEAIHQHVLENAPKWAGVIVCWIVRGSMPRLSVIREAGRLHNTRMPDKEVQRAARNMAFRYQRHRIEHGQSEWKKLATDIWGK